MLVHLAASIVQPMIYSIVKGVSGRGFRRAEREYFLVPLQPLRNIEITNKFFIVLFIFLNQFNSVFTRNNLPRT